MPNKKSPRKGSSRQLKTVAKRGSAPVQRDESIDTASETMRGLRVKSLPVAEGDALVGRIEADPDRRAARYGHDPASLKVGANMTGDAIFCFEDQSVEEAREKMIEAGLDQLPIVDHSHRFVGMVRLEDVEPLCQNGPQRELCRADVAPGSLPKKAKRPRK